MQEELSNLKALRDSIGWNMILDYAKGQIENRMPLVLSKLDNLLDVPGQEYEKGEISGIELFRKIPELVIEDLEERVNQAEKELNYASGERTRDDDSGDGGDFEPAV